MHAESPAVPLQPPTSNPPLPNPWHRNRRAYMSMVAIQRWLSVRFEILSDLMIFIVAVVCITSRGGMSANLSSLALSQASLTLGLLTMVIRMAA